jgi:hypothetical protein
MGIIAGLVLSALNQKATDLIDGDGFRQMLDQETSKGMHFEANYAPLVRDGWLGLRTDSFHGDKGEKTIVSMDAHGVTGWFNPLGIGLRRWQVDDIHIQSGTVKLQKTEPTPGAPKGPSPIPWSALFWPYRVYLEDIKVDDADVLFDLQKKESGIYHTFLEITPNGRDFEYDGKGGTFQTPMTPALHLEHVHLLVRKPKLYCPVFILGDDPAHPEHHVSIHGEAGLQDDRSITVSAKIDSIQIGPWLGEKMRDHVLGQMSGQLDYHSTGTGLETASAKGALTVANGILHDLPVVKEYVKLTHCPDPGDLHLQVCQTDITYDQGALTAENFKIECPGVFKLEGTVTMAKDKTLSGQFQLGLTEPYTKWLPTAQTAIFTQTDGAYRTTTVHVSGTSEKPVQDLSPRVIREIEKSPLTEIKLFFRAL